MLGCRIALFYLLAFAAVSQTTSEPKPGQIAGVVRRADTQQPLDKASVTLYPQSDSPPEGGSRRVARTGADGSFLFAGLPPGAYSIEASHNGFIYRYGDSTSPISLRSGEARSNLTLTLVPAGVIFGVVMDRDHEPVEGLSIMPLRVRYEEGGEVRLSGGNEVITDDRGGFRLYNLYPGLYYLRTGGPLQRPMTSMPLKQGPDTGLQYADTWYPEDALSEDSEPLRVGFGAELGDITIKVSTAPIVSITGRIEGGTKGLKTTPTDVMFTKALPVTLMFGQSGAQIELDGSFQIHGLSPGEYVLAAQSTVDGVMRQQGYAKVDVADRNARANIELGNGGAVRGRIVRAGSDASVPAGVMVLLYSKSSIEEYPSAVDSGGHFDVANVPPGKYSLGLTSPGGQSRNLYISEATCGGVDYATQTLTLDTGTILRNCELTANDDTGILRGQVIEGEMPVPQATVVLVPQSRELRRLARYTGTAKSGEQGRFEIAGVIPGNYFLLALRDNDDTEAFALSFADRHKADVKSVHFKPKDAQTMNVSPLVAR